MADGCVCADHGVLARVSLALSARDRAHVEAFRVFLEADYPVRILPARWHGAIWGGPQASISVWSIPLAAALVRLGVIPRKGQGARAAKRVTNRHFWRGVVDGDGSINFSQGRPVLNLVGSRELMEQFVDFVRVCAPGSAISARACKRSHTWRVSLCGSSARRVIAKLYTNAPVVLARKGLLALTAIRWIARDKVDNLRRRNTAQRDVVDAEIVAAARDRRLTFTKLKRQGLSTGAARSRLHRALARGVIVRVSRGVYAAP